MNIIPINITDWKAYFYSSHIHSTEFIENEQYYEMNYASTSHVYDESVDAQDEIPLKQGFKD